MRRAPATIAALLVGSLALVTSAGPAGARAPVEWFVAMGFEITLENTLRVTTQLPNPEDNSVVLGGHLSPLAAGCEAGVQAFFGKEDVGGGLLCERYAHAGAGCSGTGSNGPSLFAGITSIDPDFIVSSTQTDMLIDPDDGATYSSYTVLLAWTNTSGDLQATWGALVLRHNLACQQSSDLYFGIQPVGTPLEDGTVTCDTLCAALAVEHDQYAIKALALDHGALGAVGWFRPPAGPDDILATKDILVARLEPDLSDVIWSSIPEYGGDDVAHNLAISEFGDFFVTGEFGLYHDYFVVRFNAAGNMAQVALATGPLDDEGQTVTIEPDPDHYYVIDVQGFFTDEALFGDVEVEGRGITNFVARYDYFLNLLSLDVDNGDPGDPPPDPGCSDYRQSYQIPALPNPLATPSTPSATAPATHQRSTTSKSGHQVPLPPPPSEPDFKDYPPIHMEVVAGDPGTGSCAEDLLEQVSHSDDEYLHFYAQHESAEEAIVTARYVFQIKREAHKLRHVRVEFHTEYCAQLVIKLSGGAATQTHSLPVVELCPLDDQIITAEIPPEVVDDFGYNIDSVDYLPPLVAEVQINLLGDAPCPDPGTECNSSGKDCDLDEVEIGSDY